MTEPQSAKDVPICSMQELPDHWQDLPTLDRRSFLRTGVAGALLLGSVGLGAGLTGCTSSPAGHHYQMSDDSALNGYQFRFLTTDDIALFEALLPAILDDSLPTENDRRGAAIQATIERLDGGITRFGPPNQKELRRLFDLLTFSLTRITVARVWPDWPNASKEDASAFLARWRNSRVGLFNNGYIALIKLCNSAFYGYRDHWHLSGYPGPPRWATDALPQFQTS